MKFFTKSLLGLVMASASLSASAVGWPADYKGVMLQGFYWDSYTDTKWTNLEAQSDELSKYFSLIWVPNSGWCNGYNNMGYMPVYWFTNHNSSFGTEAELLSMIKTYKQKGTGIIADVVINHRNAKNDWYNFPAEEWNGTTWKIGLDGICCNDEMANHVGEYGAAKPTGAYDTGENFDGCRDLDHTNANVQNNCKNYCKALLEKYGYTGFRYDMVKGYSGQFNKIYNQYSRPTFSVGEYWDGSYDAVAAWIEATGRESAAFDFPGKYAINEAFASGDMTKLCWKANGTTDQPAGLIHFGYTQLAVTFIDNHDTYRDGSKFTGNVVAANAFILMSPGTPCVFLPHYKANKAAIQTLINIRNSVGIHNNSAVKVLRSSGDCYMAEVTGKNGKAVVKIGPAMVSPSGYSDSDIKASGDGYCVWTKVGVSGDNNGGEIGGGNTDTTAPAKLYVMGDLAQGSWTTNVGVSMTKSGDKFTANDVELVAQGKETKAYFSFVTTLGTTGDSSEWDGVINGSDRYGAPANNTSITAGQPATMQLFAAGVNASSAYSWGIEPGKYTVTADFSNMTVTLVKTGEGGGEIGGGDDTPEDNSRYVYFNSANCDWSKVYVHYWGAEESKWPGKEMTKVKGTTWKYELPAGVTGLVFNLGSDAGKTGDLDCVYGHVYYYDKNTYKSGDAGAFFPESLYVMGNLPTGHWTCSDGVAMSRTNGNVYTAKVTLTPEGTNTHCYFSFSAKTGATWDDVNAAHRFGAPADDTLLTLGEESDLHSYHANVNASAVKAWKVPAGTYNITANLDKHTVTVSNLSSIVDELTAEDFEAEPVYYNLQGLRVEEPTTPGIYIVVRGTTITKELIK